MGLLKSKKWISETGSINLEEAEVVFRKENAAKIMDFTNPNKKIDTTVAMLLLEFNKAKGAKNVKSKSNKKQRKHFSLECEKTKPKMQILLEL